jgi:protein-ribulosamine 3-kinase
VVTSILKQIEAQLGEPVVDQSRATGGCIADAQILRLQSGRRVFLKQARPGQDRQMLHAEAQGLRELRRSQTVRVPELIAGAPDFLLLEYIPSGAARPGSYHQLGRQFARLHQFRGSRFGFSEDNFLGASPQSNRAESAEQQNWCAFYATHRLEFQGQLAEQKGWATPELRRGLTRLLERLPELLQGTEEPPSLLHGDLWSGNHLMDAEGQGWLIDPAVYYGHREADLAMTTLFGGFPSEFYQGYDEVYPRLPGWQQREPLYHLYHLLNHLNLFGGSYAGQIQRILSRY